MSRSFVIDAKTELTLVYVQFVSVEDHRIWCIVNDIVVADVKPSREGGLLFCVHLLMMCLHMFGVLSAVSAFYEFISCLLKMNTCAELNMRCQHSYKVIPQHKQQKYSRFFWTAACQEAMGSIHSWAIGLSCLMLYSEQVLEWVINCTCAW